MIPPNPVSASNGVASSPNGVASAAALEAPAATSVEVPKAASEVKTPDLTSAAKTAPDLGEVKEYELESAATAQPDGGDALIKHRFRRSCELVDIEPGEDCAITYVRLGSRPGRELAKDETVQSVLAAEPFSPEAGSYMILTVRNDESRIRNVTAIARVRGEHGPEVIEMSPFASPSGTSPSLGSGSAGPISPSRTSGTGAVATASNANRKVSEQPKKKSPVIDPKRRAKQKPPPAMSPKTSSSKRRRSLQARDVIAPEGMTLVVISRAQAEALVDALESSVPLQAFMRPSLDVALYDKSDRQSVFPGDVAVALSPVDLESLQDAAGGEHMTELPSVLLAIQFALDPALNERPISPAVIPTTNNEESTVAAADEPPNVKAHAPNASIETRAPNMKESASRDALMK